MADAYGAAVASRPALRLVGVTSRTGERAARFIRQFGGRLYDSLDDLLADPEVDTVLNLTTQQAHAEITTASLKAGKHVYSEKPIALTFTEATRLVRLADLHSVRLSAAPSTFLAPPQQVAIDIARSGRLGAIRAAYAEVNWGRIESWHPRPTPFHEVGALVDVGVYPVTLLIEALGPIRRVQAMARHLLRERVTLDGVHFQAAAPDLVVAFLEFAQGTIGRLTTSFYVGGASQQRGIELHGDDGSLLLADWFGGDGRIDLVTNAGSSRRLELGGCFAGVDYGLGLDELADAIANERPHRASGATAAHVTEVLEAVMRSAKDGRPIAVYSTPSDHAQRSDRE